jgi:threonine 3-dehydrogenase
MSGNAEALRTGIGQMAHGGRIAILGIPTAAVELDLDPVIFNMLTLKGIYGREMYETWYQMSVMVDSGLDVSTVITHRFAFDEFEEALAVAGSGDSGKVLLDWREA